MALQFQPAEGYPTPLPGSYIGHGHTHDKQGNPLLIVTVGTDYLVQDEPVEIVLTQQEAYYLLCHLTNAKLESDRCTQEQQRDN